ncbi:hypothetical protein B0H14DRAFT_897548 [Mycena olivaceomarginata]|nr:hypothetical protein B0H14DRAFT_897548 [Mycena olivaceomarginata]
MQGSWYSFSPMSNGSSVFFSRELAQRIDKNTGPIVATVDPGYCDTSLDHAATVTAIRRFVDYFIARTPEMGSRTMVWTQLSRDMTSRSLSKCSDYPCRDNTRRQGTARQISEKLSGGKGERLSADSGGFSCSAASVARNYGCSVFCSRLTRGSKHYCTSCLTFNTSNIFILGTGIMAATTSSHCRNCCGEVPILHTGYSG